MNDVKVRTIIWQNAKVEVVTVYIARNEFRSFILCCENYGQCSKVFVFRGCRYIQSVYCTYLYNKGACAS